MSVLYALWLMAMSIIASMMFISIYPRTRDKFALIENLTDRLTDWIGNNPGWFLFILIFPVICSVITHCISP